KPRSVIAALDLFAEIAVKERAGVRDVAVVHWRVCDDADRGGNSLIVHIHETPFDVRFKERLSGSGMVKTEVCSRFEIRTQTYDGSRYEDVRHLYTIGLWHLAEVVELEVPFSLRYCVGCRNVENRGLSHCQLAREGNQHNDGECKKSPVRSLHTPA